MPIFVATLPKEWQRQPKIFKTMDRYYFYLDSSNTQRGPLSLLHLKECDIAPETQIWFEGQAEWVCAYTLEELSDYFAQKAEQNSQTPPPPPHNPEPKVNYINISNPRALIIESILVTLFCCLPGGIVSLIYALRIEDLWQAKRYQEALQAAKSSKMWLIISLCAIIIYPIIYFVLLAIGVTSATWVANGGSF